MAEITTDLPSTVEESLAPCPQFRILVVGKSGVGKSSLISCIFNIDIKVREGVVPWHSLTKKKDIDIAHNRAGKANVEVPYTSPDNPRFVLHDSEGFEAGKSSHWDTVEKFLRSRNAGGELKNRVHAIWLCIETPRTGERMEQTGDENLILLAKQLEIPSIVVFTKFDLFEKEYIVKARNQKPGTKPTPQEAAEGDFKAIADSVYSQKKLECVRIVTKFGSSSSNSLNVRRLGMLRELTDITRQSLRGVEAELWVPWAAAQQISARQKVEESIRYYQDRAVKGQYWIDLGKSTVFPGHRLIECVRRIFQDILQVWNFNDPNNLLLTDEFFAQTIQLVDEFSPKSPGENQDDTLSKYSDVASLATAAGATFAQVAGGIGIGLLALKYLYRTYQALPTTARYLGAYIIDLTVVLHRIFTITIFQEPPRILSKDILNDEIKGYKDSADISRVHDSVRAIGRNPTGFEEKIVELIQELLR